MCNINLRKYLFEITFGVLMKFNECTYLENKWTNQLSPVDSSQKKRHTLCVRRCISGNRRLGLLSSRG